MRDSILVVAYLAAILNAGAACAEEPYWANIRTLSETAERDKDKRQDMVNYVTSLTPEQLIVAGRQCSREVEQQHQPRELWNGHAISLGFFYQFYPLRSGDTNVLGRLLDEIADTNQCAFWRGSLLMMLGNQRLGEASAFHAVDRLCPVLRDPRTAPYVSERIPHAIGSLFAGCYQGQKGKAVSAEATNRLAKAVQTYVGTAFELLKRDDIPGQTQLAILGDLGGCYRRGLPATERVREGVERALRDYQHYHHELWLPLAKYSREMKITNVEDVVTQIQGK